MNDDIFQTESKKQDKTADLSERIKRFNEASDERIRASAFIVVGAILCIAIFALSFIDLDLEVKVRVKSFLANALLLAICTYWFYINAADKGVQSGRDSDPYLKATAVYESAKKRAQETGALSFLPLYCREWTETQLRTERTACLSEGSIKYETYEKSGWSKLTDKEVDALGLYSVEKIAIKNANRCRAEILRAEQIANVSQKRNRRSKNALNDPAQKVASMRGAKLAKTVCSCVLAAGIVVSTAINMTWGAFALCLLKIAIMIVTAIEGYLKHYNCYSVDCAQYKLLLADHLDACVEWAAVRNDKKIDV